MPRIVELFRAALQDKPIVAMLEAEQSDEKGGMTVAECRTLLVVDAYRSVWGAKNAPLDRTWASKWEFGGEVTKWGGEWGKGDGLVIPTAEGIFTAIFEGQEPIE